MRTPNYLLQLNDLYICLSLQRKLFLQEAKEDNHLNIDHLAYKIIEVIKELIDEQIIICNRKGIIIASTDNNRLGKYHQGAALVVRDQHPLVITEKLAKELEGVKTGINLPLFFNKKVIGVIGITGETKKVEPFGEIVRKMTELLINENYYHEQFEFEHRPKENFIFEWLHSGENVRLLTDRAETLGISLEGDIQVILISINKEDSMTQKNVWHYIHNYLPEKDTLIRWGNNRFFWLHMVSEKDQIKKDSLHQIRKGCETIFTIQINIGVGNQVSTSEINHSYHQALTALKYSSLERGVCFHRDLQLELCLQDISEETKRTIIHRTIDKIIHQPQLLHTLKIFIEEDLSPQKTANRLFVHVNTLHYRLSRIEKLTQLNPKYFNDAVILFLAIAFLEETTIY